MIKQTKRFLTSGQAATVLGVAPRTVSAWMDRGVFPNAFRAPPGKKAKPEFNDGDRRIPIGDVAAFAAAHSIPLKGWHFRQAVLLVEAPERVAVPLLPDHVELRRLSYVGAAHLLGGESCPVSQLILWLGVESRIAVEVSRLSPAWMPPPIFVLGQDGIRPPGLPADAKVIYGPADIPWTRIVTGIDAAVGVYVEPKLTHKPGRHKREKTDAADPHPEQAGSPDGVPAAVPGG